MPLLSRGQKVKLADVSPALQLRAGIGATSSTLGFDVSCFGLDHNAQLADDRYFVFYNQPASPEGALRIVPAQSGDTQSFDLDLSQLPDSIQRLVFVLTIDGQGEMSQLQDGYFRLEAQGQEVARFSFGGQDFQTEKALMVAEIYFKDVWRLAAIGQGFAGGLQAVLEHFGGQEAEPDAEEVARNSPPDAAPNTASQTSQGKVEQLQLQLEQSAPHLIGLSQLLTVSLQQAGLQDARTRVALVLDASDSMRQHYTEGVMQAVVSRLATLALRLDDNGELDVWAFAAQYTRLPVVTLDTVKRYVKGVTGNATQDSLIGDIGLSKNEPPVIREVIETYRASALPAFVVFISDGGTQHSEEIEALIREASSLPIFWQFVGLGGRNYGILERLDTMSGRTVDNANFFHIDDLHDISDEELYNRLLSEFPTWLKESKQLGIVK